MMDFPAEFVINSTLKLGVIYKIVAPEFINIEIPHYYIVVAIEDEHNYLCVCTTQLDKKINYFENSGLHLDSLVYIEPNGSNGLTNDTYVDCNQYFSATKRKLYEKVGQGVLNVTGNLSEEEYNRLLDGIYKSDINDIPKKLLRKL
ncbi:MAG: hypothetical protein KG029_04570 [Bacteroidetes bacterium]|nr:hypothetical protein [Bacteroidota bacterium]